MPEPTTDIDLPSSTATAAELTSEALEVTRRTLSRRKIIAQIIAFIVGVGLLAWCIAKAFEDPRGWESLRDANPWLIVGMIGCTIVSLFVNGTVFWATLQPYARSRFDHMHYLNLCASVLNYAPVRLGLIVRIIYHIRIDGLTLLQVGAWITAVTFTVFLTIAACIGATLPRTTIDTVTIILTVILLFALGYVLSIITRHAIVERYGHGLDRVLSDRRILATAVGLRLIEIAAIGARMWCGCQILGLELSPRDVMLLAYTDLFFSVNPIGRVGYREAAIAFVATLLTSHSITGAGLNASMTMLGLIVSAGELMIVLPTGLLALLWLWKRWTNAPRRRIAVLTSST